MLHNESLDQRPLLYKESPEDDGLVVATYQQFYEKNELILCYTPLQSIDKTKAPFKWFKKQVEESGFTLVDVDSHTFELHIPKYTNYGFILGKLAWTKHTLQGDKLAR